MKILIPTIGSRGDVQPFIALAQGLAQNGHRVTLASHPMMKSLVESYCVTFAPMGPDIDLAKEVTEIRQGSGNVMVGLMRGMQFSFKILEQSHEDILGLCKETELVVVPSQSACGKNEAELSQLPYLSVNFLPWGIPYVDPERPFFKRILYRMLDRLIGLITNRPLNKIRKRQGLPPVGPEGFNSKTLNLVPISPKVFPPNPLWSPQHHVVGYWFVDEPDGWQPPADLKAFLEKGEPPVIVSLGAMSLGSQDANETASLFVDAIQQTGLRAIFQNWETELAKMTLPAEIYVAGSLPHSWLLPHCTGIVHHGGFGTTSAALRAGIPALVIPHLIDQFYWGQRVHELGAGPESIRRADLDVDRLAAGLIELVNTPQFRVKASTLGEQIRAETGLENAVCLIEEMFPY